MKKTVLIICAAIVGIVVSPHIAAACPVCFGAAQDKTVDGMNMAIMSMLGIVGLVLSAFGTFFMMLRKRL